jgi:hypothetical protein
MRGLVVVRCGRDSLHWDWLDARRGNWDLALCPYQEIDARGHDAQVIPGQKWDGLAAFFATNSALRDYDYIWLPDDDIATDAATLNALFTFCDAFKIDLAAPALAPDSYFSHLITIAQYQLRRAQDQFRGDHDAVLQSCLLPGGTADICSVTLRERMGS